MCPGNLNLPPRTVLFTRPSCLHWCQAARAAARNGLLGATVIAAAGLLKLNLMGPGLTEALKALWRRKKPAAAAAAAPAAKH